MSLIASNASRSTGEQQRSLCNAEAVAGETSTNNSLGQKSTARIYIYVQERRRERLGCTVQLKSLQNGNLAAVLQTTYLKKGNVAVLIARSILRAGVTWPKGTRGLYLHFRSFSFTLGPLDVSVTGAV